MVRYDFNRLALYLSFRTPIGGGELLPFPPLTAPLGPATISLLSALTYVHHCSVADHGKRWGRSPPPPGVKVGRPALGGIRSIHQRAISVPADSVSPSAACVPAAHRTEKVEKQNFFFCNSVCIFNKIRFIYENNLTSLISDIRKKSFLHFITRAQLTQGWAIAGQPL